MFIAFNRVVLSIIGDRWSGGMNHIRTSVLTKDTVREANNLSYTQAVLLNLFYTSQQIRQAVQLVGSAL